LARGASDGVKTTHAMPVAPAASARARPWLPADAVTSTGRSPRSARLSAALKAPRTLKAFERCWLSSLIQTSAPVTPDSQAERTNGVRRTCGVIRRRASSTAMIDTVDDMSTHPSEPLTLSRLGMPPATRHAAC
jgi:hypothetical protein